MSSTAATRGAIVNPMLLSHGTLMCKDMAKSRRFYEEFLGLEVVRHARPAMMLRLKTGMYVVCVCIGERVPNQHVMTHWGLNVATREEVDRAHAAAVEHKEKYGIQKINKVLEYGTAPTASTSRTSTTTGGRSSTSRARSTISSTAATSST